MWQRCNRGLNLRWGHSPHLWSLAGCCKTPLWQPPASYQSRGPPTCGRPSLDSASVGRHGRRKQNKQNDNIMRHILCCESDVWRFTLDLNNASITLQDSGADLTQIRPSRQSARNLVWDLDRPQMFIPDCLLAWAGDRPIWNSMIYSTIIFKFVWFLLGWRQQGPEMDANRLRRRRRSTGNDSRDGNSNCEGADRTGVLDSGDGGHSYIIAWKKIKAWGENHLYN